MPTIKFRKKKLTEVYDTHTLVVNVLPLNFYYEHRKLSNDKNLSKANTLKDVNTIKYCAGNITV